MYDGKFAEIKTTITIDIEEIRDLLQVAFNCGQSYWIRDIQDKNIREDLNFCDFRKGGKLQNYKNIRQWFEIMPTIQGCSVVIKVDDPGSDQEKEFVLDPNVLKKGLQIMADQYPDDWTNLLNGQKDRLTADVFMQCCVYGKVAYT